MVFFSEWDTEFQQWFILHVSWYEGVTWAHAHDDDDDSDANNNSDDNVNDNDNENDNEKVFIAK